MHKTSQIVEASWLGRPSPQVAPELVGCCLVRLLPNGQLIKGLIVETEAYAPGDPACHAYRRRTARNAVMFGPPGFTYIYLIYGRYCCLNLVTDQDQVPSAVLIRALELEVFPESLGYPPPPALQRIAAGPGKLCQALKIDRSLSGQALQPDTGLWLEHRRDQFHQTLKQQTQLLVQTTRIGLSVGENLPWRWYLRTSPAVSRP